MKKPLNTVPRYPTGVVAEYLDINTKTLINFENAGLTKVAKNEKNRRLYSELDVFRVILILHLLNEARLNYQGCNYVLKLISSHGINFSLLKKIISSENITEMFKKAHEI